MFCSSPTFVYNPLLFDFAGFPPTYERTCPTSTSSALLFTNGSLLPYPSSFSSLHIPVFCHRTEVYSSLHCHMHHCHLWHGIRRRFCFLGHLHCGSASRRLPRGQLSNGSQSLPGANNSFERVASMRTSGSQRLNSAGYHMWKGFMACYLQVRHLVSFRVV